MKPIKLRILGVEGSLQTLIANPAKIAFDKLCYEVILKTKEGKEVIFTDVTWDDIELV